MKNGNLTERSSHAFSRYSNTRSPSPSPESERRGRAVAPARLRQLEAAKVQFITDFMARAAFVAKYNSLNNTQYVDTLLSTAGVTLSSRQSMIDGLNNAALTRAAVLRQIAESPEVATKYNHEAYAVMEYFGYLRRQPDAFYLDWIRVLDQTNDPRGMVTGFVNSAEYRQRFGP